jgi:hypothetical protein
MITPKLRSEAHPVDPVPLEREPASLLAGGLLYWKIPVYGRKGSPPGMLLLDENFQHQQLCDSQSMRGFFPSSL